jgi:hypothetical protein
MTKTGPKHPNKSLKQSAKLVRYSARSMPKRQMTEYETAQKAFDVNRERLKTERLAREAAGTPVAAKKAKTKKSR